MSLEKHLNIESKNIEKYLIKNILSSCERPYTNKKRFLVGFLTRDHTEMVGTLVLGFCLKETYDLIKFGCNVVYCKA